MAEMTNEQQKALAMAAARLRMQQQSSPTVNAPEPEDQGILKNIAMGALKGASDIGSTLMWPIDATGLTGRTHAERKASLGQFFQDNANPDSWSFKGGELAADIAGSAGAGGVLAKGVRAAAGAIPSVAPYVPKVATAIETGGFRLGGTPAATGKEMIANTLTRMGGGAVTGGAQAGLINPSDAGYGALIGGALPVAAGAAGEAGRAVRAAIYDPIANPDKLVSAALLRAVGEDNAQQVAASMGRQAQTQGVRFSAAEASGNPGLAALEDTLRGTNAGGALNAQAQTNRTALADALRGIAQDDAAMVAAKNARDSAASPLYNAARAEGIPADVAKANAPLIANLMERMPKGVIERAKELARVRGDVMGPEGSVSGLHWIKKGVDDLIDSASTNGLGKETKKALLTFKGDLLTTLGELSPKYKEGLEAYAAASKPMNQMQVGRALADKLIPATSGDAPATLNAAKLAQALRNPDALAQSATKFKGANFDQIMGPLAPVVNGVNSDASRIVEMMKLGAGYGSPTARRLGGSQFIGQNLKEEAPMISKLVEALGAVPGINYATKGVASMGSMVGKGINAKLAARLEEMLATDPAMVAQALQQITASRAPMNQQLANLLRSVPLLTATQASP